MESLFIGCVGLSDRFFPDGDITERAMEDAERAARQELEAVEQIFLARGWDTAIGASGTVLAICGVAETETGAKEITADGLRRVRERVLEAGHVERLEFEAVGVERAPVFPGGVAILSGIFESLRIERMSVSDGALREGLLHDLLGRVHDEDIRDRTVHNLAGRYHVDRDHAGRVARTAGNLLDQVGPGWGLADPELAALLRWGRHAARDRPRHRATTSTTSTAGTCSTTWTCPGSPVPSSTGYPCWCAPTAASSPSATSSMPRTSCGSAYCSGSRWCSTGAGPRPRCHRSESPPRGRSVRLWLPVKWLQAHPLTQLDLEQEAEYLAGAEVGTAGLGAVGLFTCLQALFWLTLDSSPSDAVEMRWTPVRRPPPRGRGRARTAHRSSNRYAASAATRGTRRP